MHAFDQKATYGKHFVYKSVLTTVYVAIYHGKHQGEYVLYWYYVVNHKIASAK